jgi:polyketide biosynthesis acyl carrier protein
MVATEADVLTLLGSCIRQVIPELSTHTFRCCERLEDLGANSLDRAEILTLCLEALQLDIPRRELVGPLNIGELAKVLHDKLRS